MIFAMIGLGGALGAMARYATIQLAVRLLGSGFPYGVMIANVLGSFLMGIAVALLIDREGDAISPYAPMLMTGFLGGYTTFSAYSLDAYILAEDGRFGAMLLYAGGSVLLSLIALAAGITLARTAL